MCSYCHFNCFEFAFVGLFTSIPLLFSCDLLMNLNVVFRFFFFFFLLCISCRFSVCAYQEVFDVAVLLISHAFPISRICTFLFSGLLVLMACFCVGHFPPLLYVCCHWWAFPFIIFLILVVAFSFLPQEIPLGFVVKLVWWCWILLAFVCLENLISLSDLKESITGQSILGCRFLLSLDAGYLFGRFRYSFVDECPAVSCNLVFS